MAKVYLGLGSNIGDREENLEKSLKLLNLKVTIVNVSSLYETEPLGYQNQPNFLNAACRGLTNLDPFELLHFVKGIEKDLGRVLSFRYAPRPADIDILFYEGRVIETKELVIPHPQIEERIFVLIPLAEIAPQFVHPLIKKSIHELLAEVKDRGGIRKWQPTKFQFHPTSTQHTI
jgi:2-amino-4-hydroxy-6-hydroxymethyldihydropteridine diphosphokinase